jgi:hypothetical protein
MTSQCLVAAGIKHVVWIDDFFAPRTREELASAIRNYVLRLKDDGKEKVGIAAFDSVLLSGQVGAVVDAVDDVLEEMPNEAMYEAAKALSDVTGVPLPRIIPQADDLSEEEFEALKQAFGQGLQTYCLGSWTSHGVQQFANAGEDTLFLIDKEYKRENAGMDGTQILKDLAGSAESRGFCVMLTHMWGENEQEARRVDIANQHKIPQHRFSVLSKRQNPNLPIDPRFARAIRTVMTHRFNGEIAYTISRTMQSSAAETANALTAQAVSDLERVLFENADDEGVNEYDAVLRIFEIQQKHALNTALAEEGIQRQLQLSRKFRGATEELEIDQVPGDMGYFRDIRAREVFFDGAGLNKLHSPLSCGDVFETDQGERYVLLAQPCDLMVRKNGERNADFCQFALIGEPKKPDPKKTEEPRPVPDYRFYDLKDVFGRGKKLVVDFQKMLAVNLSVLDLTVFNSDGTVQLQREHPPIVLSKGWAIAFTHARGRFFPRKNKPPSVRPFGIGGRATNLAGIVSKDQNQLRYPLRRTGRLQSETSTAILVAWATFQTRAALDHDFAMERDSKPSAFGPEAQVDPKVIEPSAAVKTEPFKDHTVEPATADKPETAIGAQAEPAKAAVIEQAAPAKNDPQVNASSQSDGSASA